MHNTHPLAYIQIYLQHQFSTGTDIWKTRWSSLADLVRVAQAVKNKNADHPSTHPQLDHPLPPQRLCHSLPPFPHRGVSLNVGCISFFANILDFPDTIFSVVLEVANAGVYPSRLATTLCKKKTNNNISF